MDYKYINIPKDSASPEVTVQRFQRDYDVVIVPLGTVTKVPAWVIDENPAYAEFEAQAPKGKK